MSGLDLARQLYPKLVLFAGDRFVPSLSGHNEPFTIRRTACTRATTPIPRRAAAAPAARPRLPPTGAAPAAARSRVCFPSPRFLLGFSSGDYDADKRPAPRGAAHANWRPTPLQHPSGAV